MSTVSSHKEALLNALITRTTALVAGDKSRLGDLFLDGFIYTNAQGRKFTKESYLELFVGSVDLVWQSQEASEVEILVYDNLGIISCVVHDKASYKGDAFDAYFRSTHTLFNMNGEWKFVSSHTSPHLEAEE